MDYQETIDFLYNRLPVFQNIGARAFKPGLNTTLDLCQLLGNPQEKYPCIHVGGTNGKGSTSHMLASILQSAGYKVGLYTSPHLKSFTERIKVNGQEVDQNFVISFTSENLSNIDKLSPSFFELTVAMAFSYFAFKQVDIAVIEVGMGGRLDSTNIINPLISLITNVSLDHTQFLGDTLVKIAFEKAGIIKKNTPVVISEFQLETVGVFSTTAANLSAPILFASENYKIEESTDFDGNESVTVSDAMTSAVLFKDLTLGLKGSYQFKNIGGVLAATDIVASSGFSINSDAIRNGLKNVVLQTGLKGRWQQLGSQPDVYCDTAHNTAGLEQTLAQFGKIAHGRKKFVIGFVGDKDLNSMLRLFPKDADYFFTQPSNMRALPVAELIDLARKHDLEGKQYANVNEALEAAINDSSKKDSIYVGGSTFVVADLDEL